jgi:SP family sugar:H+ symporter-like MFS transporter
MSLECAIFIVGVIIQVTAFTSWVQIMLGRFISGLGVGGLSAAVPIVRSHNYISSSLFPHLANLQYQAETAPPQIRGAMT